MPKQRPDTYTFKRGERVSHYTRPMPGGQGVVVMDGKYYSLVRWDNGIEREVPNRNLRGA